MDEKLAEQKKEKYFTFHGSIFKLARETGHWIPQLNEERRGILYGHLEKGAVFDADFLITMCLSMALITPGLLLNSVAVIIGGMLVSPLMMPLIAAGLAMIRGNLTLFRSSTKAMFLGTVAAFTISVIIGLIVPRDTLTLEILMRGKPQLLDLLIALASGAAAAYATARPRVVASLAGVAVAAALMPPLASVAIAFTEGHMIVVRGASILFITNIVAIILGSAIMFYLMGVRRERVPEKEVQTLWVRRSIFGLLIIVLLLIAPLGYRTADQIREGQLRPATYPLAPMLSRMIKERVGREKYVDIVHAGRAGVDYEGHDISIILVSPKTASKELREDLLDIIEVERGKHIKTKVTIVQKGKWTKNKEAK